MMMMMMMSNILSNKFSSPSNLLHLHATSTRAINILKPTASSIAFKQHQTYHHLNLSATSPTLKSKTLVKSAPVPPSELAPAGYDSFPKILKLIAEWLRNPANLPGVVIIFLVFSATFFLKKDVKKVKKDHSDVKKATDPVVQMLTYSMKSLLKFAPSNLWDLYIEVFTNDLGELFPNMPFLVIPQKLLKKNRRLMLIHSFPDDKNYKVILASLKMQREAMKAYKWIIALMKSKNIAILMLYVAVCIAAGMVVTFFAEWDPSDK